jgi:hypothetical protein
MSFLYSGEYSSNPDVTGVCVRDESLSLLGVGKNRVITQAFLERLEGGFHLWSPLEGFLLVSGFAILAKPEIYRL